MIKFERFTLDNGLRVIVHQDKSTPIAAVNILYDVGARDESPNLTGFAHLFEHLMFGGSKNIPVYDTPLQMVGGNNNAFTSNDITNYYLTLPSENIETAFWLEADRMLSLAFTQKSLEVQKHVVIEEFRQRYLNQPYGDVWLLLRPLAYKKHPYSWSTIGKEISHIEEATIEQVKNFFYSHYAPNNAIMVVAGNVELEQIKQLTKKWFAPIEKRKIAKRSIPQEPTQTEARSLSVERDVPFSGIYKVYHMCNRLDKDYPATDLLSDILSNGKSARLQKCLIKEKKLFSTIDAAISGNIDNGLFIISGNLIKGVDMKQAEDAINEEIRKLQNELVFQTELEKVKNKNEASLTFSETNILNTAMNLAVYELFGDANGINNELANYAAVTTDDIQRLAKTILVPENCSTLYYNAKK